MASPNIGSPSSTVFLRSASGSVGTVTGSSATLVASNSSASSTVLRVTRLDVTHVAAGTNSIAVSVVKVAGTNSVTVISGVPVPANAAIRIYDNTAQVAVEEGQSLRIFAEDSASLNFDCEYQEFA
jgi:hypothetical protein